MMREPFPWDALLLVVLVLVGLLVLSWFDWSAVVAGLAIAAASYSLGRP